MREYLVHELIFCTQNASPVILQDSLYNNTTQSASRQSFIQDLRTQQPVQGSEQLIQQVRNEPVLRRRFIQSDGQGFRIYTINRFFRVVSQFRERLSVAVYICAGQPSRAPELISIRYRNSEQERRNIFIKDGIVVFISQYYKGFHVKNDAKVIFRYLPRKIGEVVVQYLQLVLPFIE